MIVTVKFKTGESREATGGTWRLLSDKRDKELSATTVSQSGSDPVTLTCAESIEAVATLDHISGIMLEYAVHAWATSCVSEVANGAGKLSRPVGQIGQELEPVAGWRVPIGQLAQLSILVELA